tara:strand:+ start:119 stop:226 length:108 start_codon:yes stop_codon:yes gene_type:complete
LDENFTTMEIKKNKGKKIIIKKNEVKKSKILFTLV